MSAVASDMRMISAAPIIAQLKLAGYNNAESVIEWAALDTPPLFSPAIYVVLDDETAGENRMSGVTDQRVRANFRVIIVVRAQARRSEAQSELLEREIRQIRSALMGWTHPEAAGPTEYAGGRLLSADGQRVAWAVQFRANYHLRKT